MNPPYLLLEPANFHSGSSSVLEQAIREFGQIEYPKLGIKFQIFKYDRISLPDFSWYPVFESVFLDQADWSNLIDLARQHVGDVWIDIFDTYGIELLGAHLEKVFGIKLQASVLENWEVIDALSTINLTGKQLIINISGHQLTAIEAFVEAFQSATAAQVILQIGFQAYPTSLEDTGFQKIASLKAAFPELPICFADHAAAEDPMAMRIPLIASALGCELIEKHICLDRGKTEYDFYSALELSEMKRLGQELESVASSFDGGFIPLREREYLSKSLQIPIAHRDLPSGSLVGKTDVIYRRTSQTGMTLSEVMEYQDFTHSILGSSLPEGSSIDRYHYRKAVVGAVVACRLKSSRLPKKALLPIAGVASVERCLESCLALPHVQKVVLATSTEAEDENLADHTLNGRVEFWQGDPDDVISRYIGACDAFGIDVIVRVTADCPLPCPEIANILISSHFTTGADYTAPSAYAVGTHVEIYNAEALRRVIELAGSADYSEYMTWYMRNNPEIFKVNLVDLPAYLVREYRLTLDHPEDLDMFDKLFKVLNERGVDHNAKNIFEILDANPSIPAINGHLSLQYKTDRELIETLNRATKITAR